MSLKQLAKRIEDLGCIVTTSMDSLDIEIGGVKGNIKFDKEWVSSIVGFYKARQYSFDIEQRVLTGNRFAEYQVVRLDPGFFYQIEHNFEGKNGDIVHLAPASKEFCLSYFESDRYESYFKIVQERWHRRSSRRSSKTPLRIRASDIFPNFHTIKYQPKRKPAKSDIRKMAEAVIKSCLFSLAYNRQESWELNQEINSQGLIYTRPSEDDETLEIPNTTYDSAVVTYYKVAKSSQFPSQIFLSYYHILEYHFLRIADENLHGALKTQLNDPSFKSDYENVTKLIAILKKNDSSSDEKEMLRGVLRKYVPELEFIDYVKSQEALLGEKVYSGSKQKIFGENLLIKLDKGHALSNAAGVIKHIRNALVHSSDRHTREDCFIPFSETEDLIVRYIPIVQYLAEKVIFSTAE